MMVSATMDPLTQPQEKWKVETRDAYLIVYQYGRGTRLYLLADLPPEEAAIVRSCHCRRTSDIGVSSIVHMTIKGIPTRYKNQLIHDTAEKREPPVVPAETRIILTGD